MNKKFAFENLRVWQESSRLLKEVYSITQNFPKTEMFGLTSQLRRAATSIPLNIAEGKGRYSKKEFIHFLYIARASLYEVVSCLSLAKELQFIDIDQNQMLRNLAHELQRKISRLILSLKEQL